jgi:multiple sugar transport system substrate-binding protein
MTNSPVQVSIIQPEEVLIHFLFVPSLRIGIIGASVTLVLLAGCSRPDSNKALTIAVNAGVEGSALKAAAREWGELRNTRIEVVELPYANLFEKESLDLQSRTGAYDVIMLDDPWFPKLVADGGLTPLPREPDGDFLASTLAVCRSAANFYALPYVGNSQLFFYRKDLFDRYKLGAPDHWQKVLEDGKTIGAGEKIFGYVMRAAPGNSAVTDFMPLLWAFGGDIFDPQGRPNLASPEAIDALRFMVELGKISPPGYAGFNAAEVSAQLLQGTAAMSINWPAWIAAMDDPSKSKVPGRIAFAPMPSARMPGVAELGAWLVAVPAASPHRDAAFDFIYWATDPAQMTQAALRGNPPTRRSVFQSPNLKKNFRAFPAQLAALEAARPRPRTTQWNEIENAFGVSLSQANSGAASPEEAMQRANREITAILERSK